jgi:hypothetical protein
LIYAARPGKHPRCDSVSAVETEMKTLIKLVLLAALPALILLALAGCEKA